MISADQAGTRLMVMAVSTHRLQSRARHFHRRPCRRGIFACNHRHRRGAAKPMCRPIMRRASRSVFERSGPGRLKKTRQYENPELRVRFNRNRKSSKKIASLSLQHTGRLFQCFRASSTATLGSSLIRWRGEIPSGSCSSVSLKKNPASMSWPSFLQHSPTM